MPTPDELLATLPDHWRPLAERSVALLREHQDEGGAWPASPHFAPYQYSWFRDGSFIAEGASAAGMYDEADRFHDWCLGVLEREKPAVERVLAMLAEGKQPEDSDYLPARYRLDGTRQVDDWWNFQVDGYGTWLWALERHLARTAGDGAAASRAPAYAMGIGTAVRYLVATGTDTCRDWWEENREHTHVATLAGVAAGLQAAVRMGTLPDSLRAQAVEVAERCVALIRSDGVQDGHLVKWLGGSDVDASLLAVAALYDVLPLFDPLVSVTVDEVERRLVDGGVHRYEADTFYGGGQWPILAALLAWHHARAGNPERASAAARLGGRSRRPGPAAARAGAAPARARRARRVAGALGAERAPADLVARDVPGRGDELALNPPRARSRQGKMSRCPLRSPRATAIATVVVRSGISSGGWPSWTGSTRVRPRRDARRGAAAPRWSAGRPRRRRAVGPALPALLISALVLAGVVAFSPGETMDSVRRLVGLGLDRLGAAPAVPDGDGKYSFSQTQQGSDEPVGYSPCRPIEIAVNPDGAPGNYDELVDTAIAHTSKATGLRFERVGLTDDRNFTDRYSGFGEPPPAVVAWADADEVPELEGDVAGIGGSVAVARGTGPMRYVTGMVVLDRAVFDSFGPFEQATAQAIVDHEFGHLVGLGHVDDARRADVRQEPPGHDVRPRRPRGPRPPGQRLLLTYPPRLLTHRASDHRIGRICASAAIPNASSASRSSGGSTRKLAIASPPSNASVHSEPTPIAPEASLAP